MVSWRESRLILMFITLMMVFVGVSAFMQFNVSDKLSVSLPSFDKPISSPSIAPSLVVRSAPILSPEIDNRSFPPVVIRDVPVNPFK